MAHLYLSDTPGPYVRGQVVELHADESHHAVKVARLTLNETTLVTDGVGSIATAVVDAIEANVVSLKVQEASTKNKEKPELWLAQALAKGDRDEAAIQMATEMGIDGVVPFQAARSVSVWRGEKQDKGMARWTKILTEASKQSLRAWIPEITSPKDAAGIAALAKDYELLVLVPGAEDQLTRFTPSGEKPVLLVVGPEGGLEPQEIQLMVDAGAAVVRLGDSVLRTSSAGPAALAILNQTVGRW